METDMTREEAIKELRCFIGQLTEGCQEVIKVLIPELAESEDERMIDDLNLLKEIQNYYKKNLAGLYITFAMYKRIARYFYFLGKNEKR